MSTGKAGGSAASATAAAASGSIPVQLGEADEYIDLTASPVYDNHHTSKAGGTAMWIPGIGGGAAPPSDDLKCGVCGTRNRILVTQIHAPQSNGGDEQFHDRVLYVFACNRSECSNQPNGWKAIRGSHRSAAPKPKPKPAPTPAPAAAAATAAAASANAAATTATTATAATATAIGADDWGLGAADWSFGADPTPNSAAAVTAATAATPIVTPAPVPAPVPVPVTAAAVVAAPANAAASAATKPVASASASAVDETSSIGSAGSSDADWEADAADDTDSKSAAPAAIRRPLPAPIAAHVSKLTENQRIELLLNQRTDTAVKPAAAPTATAAAPATASDVKSAPAKSTAATSTATDTSFMAPFYLYFSGEPAAPVRVAGAVDADVERLQKDYEANQRIESSGGGGGADTESYAPESYEENSTDKLFLKFQRRVGRYPKQAVRYGWGIDMLWMSDDHFKAAQPFKVPNCERCKKPRVLEAQLMPRLLDDLNPNSIAPGGRDGMEWSVVSVFVCSAHCGADQYSTEYCHLQAALF